VKLSIITRALNRLEYTTRCVAAVAKHTATQSYEHIIVNQGSTDGTGEWLDWIMTEIDYYDHVKTIQLDDNYGDWGGMLIGGSKASGAYVVQLDNDIEVPPDWDRILIEVIEKSSYGAAVLSIKGCGANPMAADPTEEITLDHGGTVWIGPLRQVTACYATPMAEFQRIAKLVPNCRSFTRRVTGGPCRVFDVYAQEMDGLDSGDGSPEQRARFPQQQKYPKTNRGVWEKLI
jgi:glycosyltransferase involved in cell wall biosynthesis